MGSQSMESSFFWKCGLDIRKQTAGLSLLKRTAGARLQHDGNHNGKIDADVGIERMQLVGARHQFI